MTMHAVYTSHNTRTVLPESAATGGSSENAIREFAEDYSRAQQAAAMADRRHPDRIVEFYMQNASVPRIPTADPTVAGSDEDTRRMRHTAAAYQLTGMFVVFGLIATMLLTA